MYEAHVSSNDSIILQAFWTYWGYMTGTYGIDEDQLLNIVKIELMIKSSRSISDNTRSF